MGRLIRFRLHSVECGGDLLGDGEEYIEDDTFQSLNDYKRAFHGLPAVQGLFDCAPLQLRFFKNDDVTNTNTELESFANFQAAGSSRIIIVVPKKQDKQEISSTAILDELHQLRAAIDTITMSNHARGVGWIWDQPTSHHGSSAASEDPQSNFKQRLLDYWDCRHPTDSTLIKCQLTGDFFLSAQVRAAHLFPKRKSASMKSACNLHHNRMWNVRNGLLLHESIERAFDEGLLCFVYNPFLKIFIVRILDIALLPIRLSPKNPDYTKTFGDLHHDGAKLILPDGKFPYHRILAMQAQEAFMRNASAMSSEDKGGIETALTLSERLQDDDWSQKDETDIDFDADPVVLVRTVNPQVELKRTIKQAKRDRRNTVVRYRSDSSSTTRSV